MEQSWCKETQLKAQCITSRPVARITSRPVARDISVLLALQLPHHLGPLQTP